MAPGNADESNGVSVLEKGTGLLEKAWDAHWAMRLICILLFSDAALLLHVQRGLWQWHEIDKAVLGDGGWIVAAFVAFTALAAIVVPAFVFVFRPICWFVADYLRGIFSSRVSESSNREWGNVSLFKFRKIALQEKDAFMYQLYEARKRELESQFRSKERVGESTLFALVAMLADWLIGQNVSGGISLVGLSIATMGNLAAPVLLLVLVWAWAILRAAWFVPYVSEDIYYPPLAATHDIKAYRAKSSLLSSADVVHRDAL